MTIYAIGFICISAFGLVSLSGSDTSANSQWSGKDVFYNFLFTSYRYALIFSSVGFFKTREKKYKILILISSLFFIDRILISGRRTDLVYYAIAVGIPYLYYTKKKINLIILIPVMVVAFQLMSLLVAVRTVTLEGSGFGSALSGNRLPDVKEVMAAKKILDNKEKGRAPEFTACCYGINAVDINNAFNFGTSYWNDIIQDFVPSQLVGQDFKQSIKFNSKNAEISGYTVFTGSTMTGFYDTYAAFGYFGCLFFFFMGYFMSEVHKKATTEGDTFNMIFYLCIIVDALHAVTHRSSLFFSGIIYFLIYLILMDIFIKISSRNQHVRSLMD